MHSSEEASRNFTMAPCVVVERLEDKQRCSRAAVSGARRNPRPRMVKVTVHEKRRVNEEQPTPACSPSRNHDSAAPRQHPLICAGAEPIHQIHDPPKPRATESRLRNRIHISAIFLPFYTLHSRPERRQRLTATTQSALSTPHRILHR